MKRLFFFFFVALQPFTSIYSDSSSIEEKLPSPLLKLFEFFSIHEDNFLEESQALWFQKGKERWEFALNYEMMRPQLWPLFEEMGLVFERKPSAFFYDYALVHGALISRVKDRINYLSSLIKEGVAIGRFVFLTGERYLLESEKLETGLNTEREMVEWVYNRSDLPKDIPVFFANAFQKEVFPGIWRRPQTKDTIDNWLKSAPQPGSCLAISNQPYLGYQHAVALRFLSEKFRLETVGPEIIGTPSVAIMLDTIAKELYAKYSEEF